MQYVTDPERKVPVVEEVDVCVIGGSCTGVFAAVTAARLGLKAAVIENNGFFGGMATAAHVCVWHTLLDTVFQKQIIAGLTEEILERLDKRDALIKDVPSESRQYVFNPQEMKIELDEMVTEAGVRPFLHTRFTAPVMKDGKVEAVVIEDKTGRRAVKAGFFIDATGDGDLASRMGLETEKNEHIQPPTTVAVFRNIKRLIEKNPGFNIGKAVFNQKYPGALPEGFLWTSELVGAGDEIMVAGTRVWDADCSDAETYTRAEMEARQQVRAMLNIIRDNFPGGKDVTLAILPTCIGVRETRHVKCLYQLTEEDVLNGKRFDDAVANGSYRVDVHHSDKPGITFRYLDGREVHVYPGRGNEQGRWREPIENDPTFYQVPFRSLVPEGSQNVLVAGRLMYADIGAYGAVRVMVNCNQTGEAAGAGAFTALDAGCNAEKIDTAKVREKLSGLGAVII